MPQKTTEAKEAAEKPFMDVFVKQLHFTNEQSMRMLRFVELNRLPANEEAAAGRIKMFNDLSPRERYNANMLIERWNDMFPSKLSFEDLSAKERKELVDLDSPGRYKFLMATRRFDGKGERADEVMGLYKGQPLVNPGSLNNGVYEKDFGKLQPSVWKVSDSEYKVFLPGVGTSTVNVPFTMFDYKEVNGKSEVVPHVYDVPKTADEKRVFVRMVAMQAQIEATTKADTTAKLKAIPYRVEEE